MNPNPSRMPLIDALKALASQLIVLHHLAAYGPLSETFEDIAPNLLAWLYDYGRIAVQVFLVVGGFLAARSLAPEGRAVFTRPQLIIWKRYLRLATPFIAAILFAILCSAVARAWMDDDAIPEKATLAQFLAHALLLHGILDFDALSAGVWYVAIDFQLFALLALLLWLGRSAGNDHFNPTPFLVAAMALASLFYFNLDAGWDNWALYFFGSYALGATAYWASDRRRSSAWLGAIWTICLAALMVDFRLRIAVALAVALALGLGRRSGLLEKWPEFRPVEFLSRISFSVFLVHFPIYLVVSALYDYYDTDSSTAVAIFAMAVAWASSIAAGYAFYQLVESRSPGYWPSRLLAHSSRLLRRSFR